MAGEPREVWSCRLHLPCWQNKSDKLYIPKSRNDKQRTVTLDWFLSKFVADVAEGHVDSLDDDHSNDAGRAGSEPSLNRLCEGTLIL